MTLAIHYCETVGMGTDVVGMGTEAVGQSGDGYSVHGDGRGWGSVPVPMQTSSSTPL